MNIKEIKKQLYNMRFNKIMLLVDDLYLDYEEMSVKGQKTLDEIDTLIKDIYFDNIGSKCINITCPKCREVAAVYHLDWTALECKSCKESVNKEDWISPCLLNKGVLENEMVRKRTKKKDKIL